MSTQDWSRLVHKGRRKTKGRADSITVTKSKCGTYSGYASHYYYKNLPPCEPCKQARNEYMSNWDGSTPEQHAERWRIFKQKNPDYKKIYHKNNPEQSRKDKRRRRAKELQIKTENYTEQDVFDLYGTDCHICLLPIDLSAPRLQGSKEGWEMGLHLDHLIPISVGGDDLLSNIRPAHVICNLRKGKKYGVREDKKKQKKVKTKRK